MPRPLTNIPEVLTRLRNTYGPRPPRTCGKGVDVLVETILSQNTSNKNSQAGYRQLRRRFKTWDEVADAPVEEVERWIRVSGLSRLKAPRIQAILRQIRTERGRISLEFLKRFTPEQAIAYLRQFKGIGPKTIDCLLLFAFAMPVFPVDTHIHRIARRLKWIGPKVSAEKAHDLLEPAIPPEHRYEMHVLLIDHGRQTCKAINPRCNRCPLLDLCPYGKAHLHAQEKQAARR
ncbi:MAG: endonuclease III domain-containing protein [Phycisphaerae bacterium]